MPLEEPPNDATAIAAATTTDATLKEKRWTIPKGQWDILTVISEFALDRACFFPRLGWTGLIDVRYVRTQIIQMMNTVPTPTLSPMPRPRS